MKVVVVSEFVDPARNSTGYYWHSIVTGLAAAGHEVHVVTTRSSAAQVAPAAPGVTYLPREDVAYSKTSALSRLRGLVGLSASLMRGAWRALGRGDIVFTGTNPPFLLLLLALLRPILGFRWIVLVHDVFPENLLPAGLAWRDSIGFRVAKRLFDAAYRRADALVSIGRDMSELLARKTGKPDAVHFVPNWVDLDAFAVARRSGDAPDKVVFQFFGNIGRLQGIDCVLAAIARVKRRDAAFRIVGDGAMAQAVRAFVAAHPGIDIRFDPPVPMSRNHEVLADCDVAIVALAPGMKALGVPSKAYFSMAADKPLLLSLDRGCELHRMVEDHPEAGWFCEAGDVEALATLFESIGGEDLPARRGRVRRLVETHYSRPGAIGRILRVLGEVAAKP